MPKPASTLLCLLLLTLAPLRAQDTGQVCVQCFDDRDGDGLRAADEGSVAHGIGAALMNLAGVTIQSKLLEDSPFAADGLLCFDDLPAGDYHISLSSAEFASASATVFAASVAPGKPPTVIEFGVIPLFAQPSSRARAPFALDANSRSALLQALIVSLLVFAILSVAALLIFVFLYRRRSSQPPTQRQGATDG